jgi:FtsP/CotA-like multicopper oxidase with cupredoxin domain
VLTRRELLKTGVLSAAGSVLLPATGGYDRASSFFDGNTPSSPFLTPFIDPLPALHTLPELTQSTSPFTDVTPYAQPFVGGTTKYYNIAVRERFVKFHSQLPATSAWTYVDAAIDPTGVGPGVITFRYPRISLGQPAGGGFLVRVSNELVIARRNFGVPTLTVHFHGGHQPSPADGFPHDLQTVPANFPDRVTIPPRAKATDTPSSYDYSYPFRDVGVFDGPEDPGERPSFYWFHDHLLDFTGQNVYKGLAHVAPAYDEIDTGNENEDPHANPFALRLPSGEFDLPLVLQDKAFDSNGQLVFDVFNQDGFLGDTNLVNGVVQPFHVVKRRKYRLRFLNGNNARIYRLFLTNEAGNTFPMTQIATEGGLLTNPIPISASRGIDLAMAERVEVVVDFAAAAFDNQPYIYLENRLAQTDGRKPDGIVSRGARLMKIYLGEKVADPSQLPPVLRPITAITQDQINAAQRRSFQFDRSDGVFTINGKPVDIERPILVPRNTPQYWHFENSSGGWWHPIHVHSEFMRVIKRNGATPPANERDGNAKKDTVLLRGGDSVDVYITFRDYSGPFVFHCHNLEHEDMAMMLRFDVV